MLDDTTRKVYRILYNRNSHFEFNIDVSKLARLSMRTEQQVKDAVNWLVKERYINWDKEKGVFKIPFK